VQRALAIGLLQSGMINGLRLRSRRVTGRGGARSGNAFTPGSQIDHMVSLNLWNGMSGSLSLLRTTNGL